MVDTQLSSEEIRAVIQYAESLKDRKDLSAIDKMRPYQWAYILASTRIKELLKQNKHGIFDDL
jgi:hypothetical protein